MALTGGIMALMSKASSCGHSNVPWDPDVIWGVVAIDLPQLALRLEKVKEWIRISLKPWHLSIEPSGYPQAVSFVKFI